MMISDRRNVRLSDITAVESMSKDAGSEFFIILIASLYI